MYKTRVALATITVPTGIMWQEVEERCVWPMLMDNDYEIKHELVGIRWSEKGKHYDVRFSVTAKDHEVAAHEITLLLHRYCNVKKEFKL